MKTVATFLTLDEAYLAQMELKAGGVEGFLPEEMTAGVFPTEGYYGGIRLQVQDEDESKAKDLLKEFFETKSAAVDWPSDQPAPVSIGSPIARIFRMLVVLDALLIVFWYLYVPPAELTEPPGPVAEFLKRWTYSEAFAEFTLEFLPWVSVASLLAAVGLFFFFQPARQLYVWTWIAYFLLMPFFPVAIGTGLPQTIASLQLLLGGFLIAVIFFSPVASKFEGKRDGHRPVFGEKE